jgi:pimeloyl-ACP methyl ester carboxylesterase
MLSSVILGIIIPGLLTFFAAFFVTFTISVNKVLNIKFGGRWNLPAFKPEDCPTISTEGRSFTNQNGVRLAACIYRPGIDVAEKGLFVFAPGFTSPHRQYLYIIEALCNLGYTVFSFDNQGCGESEGEGLGGLEQALFDLRSAIRYITGDSNEQGVPLYLAGHSMGAWAAMTVLCEEEVAKKVQGVLAISGFNKPLDVEIMSMGFLGKLMRLPLRYLAYNKWKKQASWTAEKGLLEAATNGAPAFKAVLVYSHDDKLVPNPPKITKALNEKVKIQYYNGRGHLPYIPEGMEPQIAKKMADFEVWKREEKLHNKDLTEEDLREAQDRLDRECLEMERGLDKDFLELLRGNF